MRYAVLLAFALLALVGAIPGLRRGQVSIPEVTISGGRLPGPVSLAPTDADAFRRRINLPPRLEFVPETTGPSYTVTDAVLERGGET